MKLEDTSSLPASAQQQSQQSGAQQPQQTQADGQAATAKVKRATYLNPEPETPSGGGYSALSAMRLVVSNIADAIEPSASAAPQMPQAPLSQLPSHYVGQQAAALMPNADASLLMATGNGRLANGPSGARSLPVLSSQSSALLVLVLYCIVARSDY